MSSMTVKDRLRASKSNRTKGLNIPQQKISTGMTTPSVNNSSDSDMLKLIIDSTSQLNSKIDTNNNVERIQKLENEMRLVIMQLNNKEIITSIVYEIIEEGDDNTQEKAEDWKTSIESEIDALKQQTVLYSELKNSLHNIQDSINKLESKILQLCTELESIKENTSKNILKFANDLCDHNSSTTLKINKNAEDIKAQEQKIKSFSKKVKEDIKQLETKLKTDVTSTLEKNETLLKESNKALSNKMSNALTKSKDSIELKINNFSESQQLFKVNIENEKLLFKNKLDEIESKIKKSKDLIDTVSKAKVQEQSSSLLENYTLELAKLNVMCETSKMMQRENNYMKHISAIISRLDKLEKNIKFTA